MVKSKNIFKILKDVRGISLIETLFAVVIGALVMGMMMVLNVGVSNNMTMGVTLAEINSDGRQVMDKIVRDMRWATQVETSRSISSVNYVTGNDEIVFQIPSIDSNGTVIPSTYDYVAYVLDSSDATKLRKIIDPDGASSRASMDEVIAQNISAFSLSSEGTGLSSVGSLSSVESVEIALTISKEALQNKAVNETINSEVVMRN